MPVFTSRTAACALIVIAATLAPGVRAQTLTLQDAVELARERNGSIRAAMLDLEASKSRSRQAFAEFLPEITADWRQSESLSKTYTGPIRDSRFSVDRRSGLTASWRILDAGQRDLSFRAARRSEAAQAGVATQTMRSTLFGVYQRYFEALRAQELLRVVSAQVERAAATGRLTRAGVEVGSLPRKDVLQSEADLLNARVSELGAQNRLATSQAELKAIIGWDGDRPLPELADIPEPADLELEPMEAVVQAGLVERPDLQSRRLRLESARLLARRTSIGAGINYAVDLSFSRSFSQEVADGRTLTLAASYPLFDGGLSREAAREARLGVLAAEADLAQAEREARAEIESAYQVLKLNSERLKAAKLAREAAKVNFEAASKSFEQGAEGTSVITVLTAQVSLVTAESNFVEALYDVAIAEARLRLTTGRPLP